MDIKATKLELMQLLLQTQKESLLLKLMQVFEEEQVDWWEQLSREEQKEIKQGLKQADQGDVVPHDQVLKRFDKWR